MRVLILGANGLIGNTILRVLSMDSTLTIFGTVRSSSSLKRLFGTALFTIYEGVDVNDIPKLLNVFDVVKPAVVINCIGATKHKIEGNLPLDSIELNALFPHKLAQYCRLVNARLIQISTDCVFSGEKGAYSESDRPDAEDIYGRSKALGEVLYGDSLTIRTSTIGHELETNYGLLNWFLAQKQKCKGYKRAIFSGLPTVVLAEIIRDYIIHNPGLTGLYHISAQPINKYELLTLISSIYQKEIYIEPEESFVIDRSLDSSKFNGVTGYSSPDWESLICRMHQYQ